MIELLFSLWLAMSNVQIDKLQALQMAWNYEDQYLIADILAENDHPVLCYADFLDSTCDQAKARSKWLQEVIK